LEPLLHAHAIFYNVTSVSETVVVQDFLIESISDAPPVPANDRRTILLAGTWREAKLYTTQPGDLVVPGPQPLGPLVSVLIEPESDDGFFAWNVFNDVIGAGALAPVLRVMEAT
jgi:hypothetical protein